MRPTPNPTQKVIGWNNNNHINLQIATVAHDRCREYGVENGIQCGCRHKCDGTDCSPRSIGTGKFCGDHGVCCCGTQCNRLTFMEIARRKQRKLQNQQQKEQESETSTVIKIV